MRIREPRKRWVVALVAVASCAAIAGTASSQGVADSDSGSETLESVQTSGQTSGQAPRSAREILRERRARLRADSAGVASAEASTSADTYDSSGSNRDAASLTPTNRPGSGADGLDNPEGSRNSDVTSIGPANWIESEDLREEVLRAAQVDADASATSDPSRRNPSRDPGESLARDLLGEQRSAIYDPAERTARVLFADLPVSGSVTSSLIPASFVAGFFERAGQYLESQAAWDAALGAYSHAIALGADTLQNWWGFGRMSVRTGTWSTAEAGFLSALDLAEQDAGDEGPSLRAAILRDLGELYLYTKQPAEAAVALESSRAIDASDLRTQSLLARALIELAPIHEGDTRRKVALWPEPEGPHLRDRIELRLASLSSSLPESVRESFRELAPVLTSRRGAEYALAATGALFLILLLTRRFRGHGDLVVSIDYPQELKGTFSVHLTSQAGQVKRTSRADRASAEASRTSTRTDHYLVSRETQFRRLRPQQYYVVIDGILKDPENDQLLTEPFEEKAVEVSRGKSARVDIDVGPTECPIDVQVLWDKRPVKDAGVSVRRLPHSLRYAKSGELRLRLRKGKHIIVAGSGDRVAEQEIDVNSFATTQLTIELADADRLVFKGCPPAVEPYLHGDLSAAARALQRDGHDSVGHLLLARLHREQGKPKRAAEHFEAAGQILEAAQIRESMSQFGHAAELYTRADHHLEAGEAYSKAGDWLNAGSAYDRADDIDKAVHCFGQGREIARLIECLANHGRYVDAANVALENNDPARATSLLQRVGMTDPMYASSCLKLADIYETGGQPRMAIERLEAHITQGETQDPDLHVRLADLHEAAGNLDLALETLEKVHATDANLPNVATRIEGLRKKQSQRDLGSTQGTTPSGAVSGSPTVLLAQQRYELLDELGRGGMGVVFKARDKRLNRVVALKRLPENFRDHPKAIQLFLREAQAAARLNHRNIVTVYDTDQEDGHYFITMELLEGRPLNAILKAKQRLSPRDVARLGMQVAAGLQYAHDERVIHRDIKTANLFLTRDKTVKIMDFGLAKMIEEVRKESTVIGGTPYYMAPEQALGEAIDHRTDIYSLGITFYELLAGRVPFKDGDVTYHHRHTPPPDPREFFDGIPDGMAELTLHMIEKSIDARCGSAAEVMQRLEPFART